MERNEDDFKVFEEIEVLVMNAEDLNKFLEIDSKEYMTFEKLGLIKNKFGKWGNFDSECCGQIEDYTLEIDIHRKEELPKDTIFFLGPCTFHFYPDKLMEKHGDKFKKINLKEHMGSRFCYNGRVRSNQFVFLNWYNTNK